MIDIKPSSKSMSGEIVEIVKNYLKEDKYVKNIIVFENLEMELLLLRIEWIYDLGGLYRIDIPINLFEIFEARINFENVLLYILESSIKIYGKKNEI